MLKAEAEFYGNLEYSESAGIRTEALFQKSQDECRPFVVIFAVVLAIAFPPLACKDGVEFTRRSRGFGAGFFFLLSLRVEACEEVTNDEVGYQRLPRCQKVLCRTVRGRAGQMWGGHGACVGRDILQQLP